MEGVGLFPNFDRFVVTGRGHHSRDRGLCQGRYHAFVSLNRHTFILRQVPQLQGLVASDDQKGRVAWMENTRLKHVPTRAEFVNALSGRQ